MQHVVYVHVENILMVLYMLIVNLMNIMKLVQDHVHRQQPKHLHVMKLPQAHPIQELLMQILV